MKNFFIAIACLLITFEATAQSENDTIFWSPCYKLKWLDFKGVLQSNSDFEAISSISIDYDIKEQVDEKITDISVFCFFNRAKSKVKGDFDSILLRHEQGHFNISELFTRNLYKEFKKEIQISKRLTLSETEAIYSTIKKQYDAMNVVYENETDYSRNLSAQEKWTVKINKQLAEVNLK